MHQRIPKKRRASRVRRRPAAEFSAAFLLPDLHPWLREFFAEQNLIPIRDEGWDRLPVWEPVPEREEVRVKSEEWNVEAPVLNQSITTDSVVTSNSELSTLNSQLPSGVRPSAAPIPFVIPVHAAPLAAPSRHLVRILRASAPTPPAPDFLDTIHDRVAPLPALVRFAPQRLRAAATAQIALARVRAAQPAPWTRIPPPYDELLIVNIIVGPTGVLWRSILWPVLAALGISNLESRISNLRHSLVRTLPAMAKLPASGFRLPILRHALAFAMVLALVLLPVKLAGIRIVSDAARGHVLGATTTALDAFGAGGAAIAQSSFADAVTAFDRARVVLDAAPGTVGPLGRIGAAAANLPGLRSTAVGRAEAFRRSGIALAEASAIAARGLALLDGLDLRSADAADRVRAATAAFASARRFASDARASVAAAAPALLPHMDRGIAAIRAAEAFAPVAGALAGLDAPRRILLVFQNPAELRPTGGFIGSTALLDVRGGRVESLELPRGGSYDLSGVSRARVLPPEPFRVLTNTWQLHDANWFPDFPATARKLRWFFTLSGGPTVDAVVAVNAPFLSNLLEVTGPIAAGGRMFTASDALTVLTDTIETPAARANGQPKAILAELAPAILERLLALSAPVRERAPADRAALALLDRVIRALDERDLRIHFSEDRLQRLIAEAGWAGELRAADRDALMVVHANIGGGKSDARIEDAIAHAATILADGTVVDTVRITRTHRGTTAPPGAPPSAQLAGAVNRDYLRVYVPRGATLLQADGFTATPAGADDVTPADVLPDRDLLATELRATVDPVTGIRITEEFGRTAFGGWLEVPPASTRTVTLTYRLPWRFDVWRAGALGRKRPADPQPYTIRLEQQSGTRATIRHTMELNPAWRATWAAANLRPSGPQTYAYEDILSSDRTTGVMVKPTK